MKTKFNPWPVGIITFFCILIGSLAGVVVIAATHRDSLVNDNYYEQELKFQTKIDETARAKKCGARAEVDPAGQTLVLNVPAGQVNASFAGEVEFYRPSAPELDQTSKLQPDAQGRLRLDLSHLTRGLWEIHVHWTAGGQGYYLEQRLVLP